MASYWFLFYLQCHYWVFACTRRVQQCSWNVILFYFIALGVHFITNDWSLRKEHQHTYDQYGRVLLTLAILLGWLIGALTELNELLLSILQAFIAGGVILNVMKEELPQEQESSISSFLIGSFGYSLLLIFL